MTKIIFGNHSAVRVAIEERESIRKFYCDVLGSKLIRTFNDKDDIRIGDDFYMAFIYAEGTGKGAEQGANYGAKMPLNNDDFLKGIFLELKTNDVEEMKKKIIAFGVKVLDVPDPHLYFQAPGGQVFRLVEINEDLSKYESD